MIACLFYLCSLTLLLHVCAQQVPTTFPPSWHTWVVTTVKEGQNPLPIYDDGRLIMVNAVNEVTCRYNQQDLINRTDIRRADYCDYKAGLHYYMNDTLKPNTGCTGVEPLTKPLAQLVYPQDFITNARFLGVDRVGQHDCNHFSAQNVHVGDHFVNLDVWVDVAQGLPCQISTLDPSNHDLVNWAFDGFTTTIPKLAESQCSIPLIFCSRENWVCRAISTSPPLELARALTWVCGEGALDCRPIYPGGDHYFPDTLVDHCNWAFNAYYRLHRYNQGIDACSFGGFAQLVPPQTEKVEQEANSFHETSILKLLYSFINRRKNNDDAVFEYDLVCSE